MIQLRDGCGLNFFSPRGGAGGAGRAAGSDFQPGQGLSSNVFEASEIKHNQTKQVSITATPQT